MNERLQAIVGARINEFRKKMAEVNQQLRNIPNRVVTEIDVRVDRFNNKLDALAERIRTFSTIGGSMMRGGMFAALPALSPILASAAGNAGALASSFAALGGGLGAFGIAAIGNANTLGKSMEEIQKLNERIAKERASLDPNQDRINELLNQRTNILGAMSKAQQSAMKQVNKFKDAWNDFLKSTQEPVFKVFAAGLKVASSLLHEMKPIIKPISDALVSLLNQFNNFSKTEKFRSFIDFFANRGSSALKNWGQIAGNVFVGFMEILKAFAPFSKEVEGGLIGLTKRFKEWAQGLSESKSFQNFINFVRNSTPKALTLIKNIGTFILEIAKGMAPLGSQILKVANSFFSWINGLMQANPVIGQVISWVVTLGGALLGLAPLFVFLRVAFSGIGGVIAKVIPWIVRIGKLLLGFSNPIGLVITIVTTLGIVIYKNWDFIKASTIKIWNAISKFFVSAWVWIKQTFKSSVQAVTGFITNSWEWIKNTTSNVWNSIKSFFTTLWTGIKTLFTSAVNGVVNFVNNRFGWLIQGIQTIFNSVKVYFVNVWNIIKNIFLGAILLIFDLVTGNFDALRTDAIAIFNNIKESLNNIWNAIKTIFFTALSLIVTTITKVWNGIKRVNSAIWNGIKAFLFASWELIKKTAINVFLHIRNGIKNAVNGMKNVIFSIWKAIKTFFTKTIFDIWESIKDGFRNMVNSVRGAMKSASETIKGIWGNIVDFFQGIPGEMKEIGINIITGLINGVKNMGGRLVDSVKGVVNNAVDGIRNLLGIHSPSTLFKGFGQDTFAGFIIGGNKMKNKIAGMASNLATTVTRSFQPQVMDVGFNSSFGGGALALDVGGMATTPKTYETREQTIVNMQGVFDGAEISIRDERDIRELARQLGEYQEDVKRSRGLR